ncbi:MAG: GC-type dockerin domain-anchored protein [Phycisphaerales bacterium]
MAGFVASARVAACIVVASAGLARAGGSPENVLILINPASADSMHLGNYYKNARNIPDRNVLYIVPTPQSYAIFAADNGALDGLFGQLRNVKLDDHIDYIVVADPGSFNLAASGLVNDSCSPLTRFSTSSIYTLAFQESPILPGPNPVSYPNQFFSNTVGAPLALDSNTSYLFGTPSTAQGSRRYFVGALLGYTGERGNTLGEIFTMIDRSVAADGTRPAGKFYYMNTTDPLRNLRSCASQGGCASPTVYNGAVAWLLANGGNGEVINGITPAGRNDILGVMTGWIDPQVDTDPMTILPGAFCDHFTSWAATFDVAAQTKISSWIRRGASGSHGQVEEPCNYLGKFPTALLHQYYFQGMSLGESLLRTISYAPFQGLFYGDPITRTFARIPAVAPGNAPTGTVSGSVTFTPVATPAPGGAAIASLDLHIDGVFHSSKAPGQPFTINTVALADGYHQIRVLAYDSTPVKTAGRWVGSFTSSNTGRASSLGVVPASGDRATSFGCTITGTGGTVSEVRLLHNGRVVAASATAPANLAIYGWNLGAGTSTLQAEVLYADGVIARSAPQTVTVAATGASGSLPPAAFSYTKRVARGGPCVIELPARFNSNPSQATFTIVGAPTGATISTGVEGYRVITAPASACGNDQITFRVTTPGGQSNTGTVRLVYGPGPVCPADYDGDGNANVSDFVFFQNGFASGNLRADIDGSCVLNINDFVGFLNAFATGCP